MPCSHHCGGILDTLLRLQLPRNVLDAGLVVILDSR